MSDGRRSGRSTGRVSCFCTTLCQLTYRTSEFRVVELKTPRFSTAIGSNLYAEDSVEYFSVYYYYYYYFKPTSTKPQEEKLR